jgi:hypothetical protein
MDDEDFQSRLDKIHEDHARFMALVESMPPLTKQQKEENRARLFAEEEPLRIAKREELSRQALQGDPHAKLYPPPDEIFPPLPWKPRIFLNLSRFHWKANIELCAVALAHERTWAPSPPQGRYTRNAVTVPCGRLSDCGGEAMSCLIASART